MGHYNFGKKKKKTQSEISLINRGIQNISSASPTHWICFFLHLLILGLGSPFDQKMEKYKIDVILYHYDSVLVFCNPYLLGHDFSLVKGINSLGSRWCTPNPPTQEDPTQTNVCFVCLLFFFFKYWVGLGLGW